MVAKLKKLTKVYGGETQETYESLWWQNSRNLREFMVAKLKKLTKVYDDETEET